MVQYSLASVPALAFLKRPYNDVDIYVEDTANPNMWLNLIRKLLPSKVHISSVIAVGDWSAVTKACRADQEGCDRKRLYIIDGDLRLLTGRKPPRLRHFHQLKAYCVENLLLKEAAVVRCALIAKPQDRENDLARKFAFQEFLLAQITSLAPLFAIYGVVHKLDPSMPTIKLGLEPLFIHTREGPVVCRFKTLMRMRELRSEIVEKFGVKKYRDAREDVVLQMKKIGAANSISGKSYLLPIMHKRFVSLFGNRYSFEQWKVQLSSYWDGVGDPILARKVGSL